MAERRGVRIRVVSQEGTCAAGHKVGDEWVVAGMSPEGVCLSALGALLVPSQALLYGGSFPWSSDPDVATAACPDAANPVVFEMRRLRK